MSCVKLESVLSTFLIVQYPLLIHLRAQIMWQKLLGDGWIKTKSSFLWSLPPEDMNIIWMLGKLAETDKHLGGRNIRDLLHSQEGSYAVMRSKGKELWWRQEHFQQKTCIEVRGSGTINTAKQFGGIYLQAWSRWRWGRRAVGVNVGGPAHSQYSELSSSETFADLCTTCKGCIFSPSLCIRSQSSEMP